MLAAATKNTRILIVYGFLAAALVYFGYKNNLEGDNTMTLAFALVALYLVYGIIKAVTIQ